MKANKTNNMVFLMKYKKVIKHLIFIFLLLSSLLLVKNNLQYNISVSHADEMHTLNDGISSMYTGEVNSLGVGESTRWLARIIYPAALYYMNGNMGGELFITGWEYPSGYYIKNHFKNPESIQGDPNLQDFSFAMKFILAALVLLSFLLASYSISDTFGFLGGIAYFTLAFSSSLVFEMLSTFYTESTLIIVFNLIVVLALSKKVNVWRFYIWAAFLLAFAICTQLTGLILVIPVIVLLLRKDAPIKKMKYGGFSILVVLFIALIYMYASSYMEVLNQTIAKISQLPGNQFSKILETLFPWIFIFLAAISLLAYKKSKELPFLLSISISSFIMTILASIFFLERGLTTPVVMMILIISVCFCYLINLIKFKPQLILIGSIFCILLIHVFSVNNNFLKIEPDTIKNYTEGSKNIATIDVEEELVLDAHSVLKGMPETFTLLTDGDSLRGQFLPYDCVVVKRVGTNKHYTNYILPMDYTLEARHGDYFVYKRMKI